MSKKLLCREKQQKKSLGRH